MKRKNLILLLKYLLAGIIAILWIIPFLGVLMTAIRPLNEVIYGWWNFKNFHVSFENFFNAWRHPTAPLSQGVKNSLLVAFPSTIFPIFISALAGYGFARFSFPIKNYLFITIVLLMSLPQQMIAVPIFQTMNNLKLLNTYLGLIVVHTAWGLPWLIFFLRNFFITLPIEIEEAAKIDGAGNFTIFFKIILPISLPALLSASVLQFMWVWSDFFLALILIYSPDKLLVTQRIPLMRGIYHVDWGALTGGTIIAMSVPLLIFAFLQRYYIKGMVGWSTR
ncbi:MAG: carbohydrate ABC transporter permease [Dictyoglomaceae bacterium]|jgi:multiple sugar transport system permease protein|nr:MAG: ABC transporter permease [Dictyoglomus turgidum]